MERTDQDFQDGLALDLFSPKNRTLVVRQNTSPLSGHFVTGTSGGPFIALSNYSYVIKMNETANDLISKIEIPYDPAALARLGVQEGNTYVGRLADNRMSWVVDEATRNVHRSENNTRIIKMTSLDGEYMLLGRRAVDVANIFVQYGQGATRTVNITGGPGRQEAEFVDGLRFSMVAQVSMAMNVDITNGIAPQSLPPGTVSLNSFAWAVNTSIPNAMMSTTMKVPCRFPPSPLRVSSNALRRLLTAGVVNRLMLLALRPGGSSPTTMLTVARRPLRAPASTVYKMIDSANQKVVELTEDRVVVTNITQVDGEYVLLVTRPTNAQEV